MNIHTLINATSPSSPVLSFYFLLSPFIRLLLLLLLLSLPLPLVSTPKGAGAVCILMGDFSSIQFSYNSKGFIGMKVSKTMLPKHQNTICPNIWTVHNNSNSNSKTFFLSLFALFVS